LTIIGAGTTTLTASQPGDGNYQTATSVSINYSINKTTPALTWATPVDIVHGTPLSGTQLNASANVPGSFAYTPLAGTVLNAGNAQVLQVAFTPTDTEKYSSVSSNVLINVQKAAATLTLANLSQVYDGTARIVSVITTPSGLTGASVSYAGSAIAPINAGTYAVAGSLNNANYTASPVNGTLVVAKATQSITFTLSATGTYGTDVTLSAVASSQLPVAFTVSGPATISGNLLHLTGGGTVAVTATQAGNGNYNPAPNVVRTIAVGKAVLQVVADNKSRAYGQANPALTVTYSGFVNGDTAAVLKGGPKLSTAATATSVVGTYTILTDMGTLSSVNYSFVLANGVLSIQAANTAVTPSNVTGKFGAAATSISANVVALSPSAATVTEGRVDFTVRTSAGVIVGQISAVVSKGKATADFPTAGLARGTYPISASYVDSLTSPNFNNGDGTTTGNLTIK